MERKAFLHSPIHISSVCSQAECKDHPISMREKCEKVFMSERTGMGRVDNGPGQILILKKMCTRNIGILSLFQNHVEMVGSGDVSQIKRGQ